MRTLLLLTTSLFWGAFGLTCCSEHSRLGRAERDLREGRALEAYRASDALLRSRPIFVKAGAAMECREAAASGALVDLIKQEDFPGAIRLAKQILEPPETGAESSARAWLRELPEIHVTTAGALLAAGKPEDALREVRAIQELYSDQALQARARAVEARALLLKAEQSLDAGDVESVLHLLPQLSPDCPLPAREAARRLAASAAIAGGQSYAGHDPVGQFRVLERARGVVAARAYLVQGIEDAEREWVPRVFALPWAPPASRLGFESLPPLEYGAESVWRGDDPSLTITNRLLGPLRVSLRGQGGRRFDMTVPALATRAMRVRPGAYVEFAGADGPLRETIRPWLGEARFAAGDAGYRQEFRVSPEAADPGLRLAADQQEQEVSDLQADRSSR